MDDLAVRRIINVPKRGIGATTLSRVQDYADENGLTFYNEMCIRDRNRNYLALYQKCHKSISSSYGGLFLCIKTCNAGICIVCNP